MYDFFGDVDAAEVARLHAADGDAARIDPANSAHFCLRVDADKVALRFCGRRHEECDGERGRVCSLKEVGSRIK